MRQTIMYFRGGGNLANFQKNTCLAFKGKKREKGNYEVKNGRASNEEKNSCQKIFLTVPIPKLLMVCP